MNGWDHDEDDLDGFESFDLADLESTPDYPDDAYSPEYLREVAGGNARQERLDELKRRIELGAYRPDADAIAAHMVGRVELDES